MTPLIFFAVVTCFARPDRPGRNVEAKLVAPPLERTCDCPGRDPRRGKLVDCFVQIIGDDAPRCVAVYERGAVSLP